MTWVELFSDHTFRTVLIGATSIGAVSAAIGCFAYLRRQSLVGDVIAHSSLLGVMLVFLVSYWLTGQGSKSLIVLIPGAMASGIAALCLTRLLVQKSGTRDDSALGIMLAIFFGTGIMLLRWVQKAEPAIPGRRGLEDYLFGMAASMTQNDLKMIGLLGIVSVLVVILFWKELKVFTFDPLFAQGLGIRTRLMEILMIVLVVNAIVIGIQCIGVVLMIAMLVTPPAAARQWTKSLGPMVLIAMVIGALAGVVGSVVSASATNLPTGPVIVLTEVVLFLVSIVVAPARGILSRRSSRSVISSLELDKGAPS